MLQYILQHWETQSPTQSNIEYDISNIISIKDIPIQSGDYSSSSPSPSPPPPPSPSPSASQHFNEWIARYYLIQIHLAQNKINETISQVIKLWTTLRTNTNSRNQKLSEFIAKSIIEQLIGKLSLLLKDPEASPQVSLNLSKFLLQIDPKSSVVHHTRAVALEKAKGNGFEEKAIKHYKLSLEINPKLWQNSMRMADLYTQVTLSFIHSQYSYRCLSIYSLFSIYISLALAAIRSSCLPSSISVSIDLI